MWRFIDGVSQPKKTKVDRKEYHDAYDKTKRQRKFLNAWTINRPWLVDTEKGMICSYCKQIPTSTTGSCLFLIGCTSYKLDSITKHENSLQHKHAVKVNDGKSKPVEESEARKIISTLNKENLEKLEKMFHTCHALIKNNRPLSDFTWICDLDEMKGYDLGRTYRNINSAKVFIQCIADVEFQKIANQIKNTKFLSVIVDGSTDSAVKEQEMWFVRGCRAGIVTVDFIGVHSASKATAENIVHGLQETVVSNLKMDWNEISNKLVGLSCDGASVMTGCKSGVRAILEKDCPSIVTIHCMAHRLELSLKDVAKKVKTYERVNILLAGLYYFYHNSALNRAVLQKTYEATKSQDEKLLIPTRVGGTRWIGHQVTAITHVITSYKFIVTHMEQLLETRERVSSDAKAKSKGFLKLLKSKVIVGFMLFLLDVLAPLRHLSLNLQDRTALISCQHDSLASALEAVLKSKTSDGPNLRMLHDQYEGTKLCNTGFQHFSQIKIAFIESIQSALQKRFSEFSSSSTKPVVNATQIADLKAWPQEWQDLREFGDKELRTLLQHFDSVLKQAGVNVLEAEIEWTMLKKEILKSDLLRSDWVLVQRKYENKFSNILAVIDLIFTISPSSAEAERGFSQLKCLKTNLRSRLNQTTLNHALSIKLHSKNVRDYDPKPAIHYWNHRSIRQRRPLFERKKSRETEELEENSDAVNHHEENAMEAEENYEAVEKEPIDASDDEEETSHAVRDEDEEFDSEDDISDDISENEVFKNLTEIEMEYEYD